ncbi:unnamed protein product, partial [Polarella glacialis]
VSSSADASAVRPPTPRAPAPAWRGPGNGPQFPTLPPPPAAPPLGPPSDRPTTPIPAPGRGLPTPPPSTPGGGDRFNESSRPGSASSLGSSFSRAPSSRGSARRAVVRSNTVSSIGPAGTLAGLASKGVDFRRLPLTPSGSISAGNVVAGLPLAPAPGTEDADALSWRLGPPSSFHEARLRAWTPPPTPPQTPPFALPTDSSELPAQQSKLREKEDHFPPAPPETSVQEDHFPPAPPHLSLPAPPEFFEEPDASSAGTTVLAEAAAGGTTADGKAKTVRVGKAWAPVLGGKKHLKTSDVQRVCERFRELREVAGDSLEDSSLSLNELGVVLGVAPDGRTTQRTAGPLHWLLGGAPQIDVGCDFRLLLVAMAGLTKAKVPDRMRFAALLLDSEGSGSLSREQLALILHANHLLPADEPIPRVRFDESVSELLKQAAGLRGEIGDPDSISHEEFLDLVGKHPELVFPPADAARKAPNSRPGTNRLPDSSRPDSSRLQSAVATPGGPAGLKLSAGLALRATAEAEVLPGNAAPMPPVPPSDVRRSELRDAVEVISDLRPPPTPPTPPMGKSFLDEEMEDISGSNRQVPPVPPPRSNLRRSGLRDAGEVISDLRPPPTPPTPPMGKSFLDEETDDVPGNNRMPPVPPPPPSELLPAAVPRLASEALVPPTGEPLRPPAASAPSPRVWQETATPMATPMVSARS